MLLVDHGPPSGLECEDGVVVSGYLGLKGLVLVDLGLSRREKEGEMKIERFATFLAQQVDPILRSEACVRSNRSRTQFTS